LQTGGKSETVPAQEGAVRGEGRHEKNVSYDHEETPDKGKTIDKGETKRTLGKGERGL